MSIDHCHFCSSTKIQVIDSRPIEDTNGCYRRYKCKSCGGRFSTLETVRVFDWTRKKSMKAVINSEKAINNVIDKIIGAADV